MCKILRARRALLASATVIALIFGSEVVQASDKSGSDAASGTVVDLTTWDYAPLYEGMRADELIDDAEIVDRDGEVMGNLEDLIMGPDGKIQKLVIGTGGFIGIGDTHFAYPWSKAEFVGPEKIKVLLDEDKPEQYSFFEDIEGEPVKGNNWRLSSLINEFVYLKGGRPYGTVNDVILSKDGVIKAVVVYPDVRYRLPGPYAWPYYGGSHAYHPAQGRFETPHTLEEVGNLKVFIHTPADADDKTDDETS